MNRLLIFILCYSVAACADVYRWQDEKGAKHYSDRAHDKSTKLVVKPGYSFVKVEKIFDGDTIKLEDGRKIRLLGVNAPEVRHPGQETEAGGDSAKRWLTDKLINKKVRLVKDAEETDKYNRVLAHVFTESKEHINLQLIETGLAAVNIYPPNMLYAEQLAAAGAHAEAAKKGIWGRAEYASVPVEQLNEDGRRGWLRITGKVAVIRSSRKFVYLEFSPGFQVRIEKQWLGLFPEYENYRGKTLEARGWLNKNRGGWSMLIRHPSALKIIPG
ncbi:MAG: DUF4124 domain-containing protein [Gammaproteobacteria bacterium]|nr:DUF4124 domain-containing protein [Gammaproteobacteria bacterium]